MSIDPKTLTPAELAFVDAMFPREEMDFRTALNRAEPWIMGRREALAESMPEEVGIGKLLVLARVLSNDKVILTSDSTRGKELRAALGLERE